MRKYPQRNSFEMKAHDVQFKTRRPSWEHNIETYTGNRESSPWVTVLSVLAIVAFIIVAFVTT